MEDPVISQQLLNTLILLTILTFPIKGVALWRSAQARQKGWYIALLVTNTFGILDLAYLFYFTKKPDDKQKDLE